MTRFRWKWIEVQDMKVGQSICLSYSAPGIGADFDDLNLPNEEVVFLYSTGDRLQTFITHDGLERKLPSENYVWAYAQEEFEPYA